MVVFLRVILVICLVTTRGKIGWVPGCCQWSMYIWYGWNQIVDRRRSILFGGGDGTVRWMSEMKGKKGFGGARGRSRIGDSF